jgi:hypothetical protein
MFVEQRRCQGGDVAESVDQEFLAPDHVIVSVRDAKYS